VARVPDVDAGINPIDVIIPAERIKTMIKDEMNGMRIIQKAATQTSIQADAV